MKKISEQSVAEVAVRMLENETLEVRSSSTEKYKRAAMDCGKYKCKRKCIAATVESSSAMPFMMCGEVIEIYEGRGPESIEDNMLKRKRKSGSGSGKE